MPRLAALDVDAEAQPLDRLGAEHGSSAQASEVDQPQLNFMPENKMNDAAEAAVIARARLLREGAGWEPLAQGPHDDRKRLTIPEGSVMATYDSFPVTGPSMTAGGDG